MLSSAEENVSYSALKHGRLNLACGAVAVDRAERVRLDATHPKVSRLKSTLEVFEAESSSHVLSQG